MKKYCRFLFLFVAMVLLVTSCADDRDAGTSSPILGAWRWANTDTGSAMIYCFAENGHLLTLNCVGDQVSNALAAHYTYENGTLTIQERGKETGILQVGFDGADTMTLTAEGQGSLTFAREQTKSTALVGNWVNQYMEGSVLHSTQYAFTDGGDAAVATYEGTVMNDYQSKYYECENGLLRIYTLRDNGSVDTENVFFVAFPYEGYMTMAPVTDNNNDDDVSKITVFMHLEE